MPSNKVVYWTAGGLLAVLLLIMVLSWDYNRDNAVARDKANELIAAYEEAGLPTPASADQVARVLGDDGGNVCATAGSRQQLGELKTRMAVGGEFYQRPVLVPRNTLEGLRLIVEVYCPENLSVVSEFVDGLEYSD
ncbi:hypothetical protein ACFYVR_13735 [Rhodococcus sp. NPDC003318]|uniref:hypothetical protein n=1 Tax=Rhodococcus sp. NPDC003318 TaxID=3364503 RepID=UPI00369CC916